MFYLPMVLSVFLIISMIVVLFLPYEDGLNVHYGQVLNFGFYQIKLHQLKNEMFINWIGILMSILVLLNTILLCYSYWKFRWSEYYVYTKKQSVSVLYGLLILFLMFLLLSNFMNRDVINLKDKDIVTNGFWDNPENMIEYLRFNYIYDVILAKFDDTHYTVNYVFCKFGIMWIIICTLGCVMILISYLVFEYFKNKTIQGRVYV